MNKIQKTADQWAAALTPDQFRITRQQGTERAFSGQYWDHHGDGIYRCVCCGLDLFDSVDKFESGTGWPSFLQPLAPEAVETTTDLSHGMKRVEVHCARCDGHLGHIFPDGPEPSGLRYCLNSGSLTFADR